MTNKINAHDAKVLATGVAVGGTVATLVLTKMFSKVLVIKSRETSLKTQFITWMFTTGIHLPEQDLYAQAQTHWDFIKQVTD